MTSAWRAASTAAIATLPTASNGSRTRSSPAGANPGRGTISSGKFALPPSKELATPHRADPQRHRARVFMTRGRNPHARGRLWPDCLRELVHTLTELVTLTLGSEGRQREVAFRLRGARKWSHILERWRGDARRLSGERGCRDQP